MNGWLARQALHLYPLAYRRRYGEEMQALLEDQPPTLGGVLDLLRGALVAHVRPARGPADAVTVPDRMRATTSGVLVCWVFFAAAGFAFYKSTEDAQSSAAGHAHPLLRDAHLAVQALAVIASVTLILGALPLIATALAHARKDARLRRKIAVAVVPLIAFGVLTAIVVVLAHAHAQGNGRASGLGNGMAIVWGVAGLAAGLTCVLACRAALFAIPVPSVRLLGALAAGTLVAAAMLAIAAAAALYAIALAADAPPLAAQPNGPFGLLSLSASLIVIVVVMAGAGGLAVTSTVRGWQRLH